MQVRVRLIAGCLPLTILFATASAQATPDSIDNSSRDSVVKSYQTWLAPLLAVPTGWTGNLETCDAGTISAENAEATLSAVNYVRALSDLPPVTMDPAKSAKSQAAALIMAANGYLTHTPPKDAKCWTKAGYEGASNGNIFLGWGYEPGTLSDSTGPRSILGYMADPGETNTMVGHRRWINYQQLGTIGTGDTETSNSLYLLPETYLAPSGTRWVPWPAAGFFPRELEPAGRWSLSYPGANFSRARIKVSAPNGLSINAKRHSIQNGYGDNTLSWDMTLPDTYRSNQATDYPISVRVTGIRLPSGRTVTHSWTTTLVKAAG